MTVGELRAKLAELDDSYEIQGFSGSKANDKQDFVFTYDILDVSKSFNNETYWLNLELDAWRMDDRTATD